MAKNGYHLTGAENGVQFDLDADGIPELWSWTAHGSDDAWLALDRNGNGGIDNGTELFGNFTAQPASGHRNGYIALAVFDRLSAGGNNDGVIDQRDSVYALLRLWRDSNHNGVSEATELTNLSPSDVRSVSLDYRESARVDQYGNRFKYRAPVSGTAGRHSYDVFLVCGRSLKPRP